jgi:hypothetical protein
VPWESLLRCCAPAGMPDALRSVSMEVYALRMPM